MSIDKAYSSSLTFRCDPQLRSAFGKACDASGLVESSVARLLMAGFISGSISIISAGEVTAPPAKTPKQLALKVGGKKVRK